MIDPHGPDPRGHAGRAALAAAAGLADSVRASLDVRSLLDLAQLWIEPMHREEDAVLLVGFVQRLLPDQPRAAVLTGYLALHYWQDDEHLRQAEPLLRAVLAAAPEVGQEPGQQSGEQAGQRAGQDAGRQVRPGAGPEVGAAALLLDEILRQLGSDAPDANIDLLRRSVAAEPSWSLNRVRLARALAARGDTAAALAEMDTAIANVLGPDPDLPPVAHSYHDLFTGRITQPDRLIAQRARLAAGPAR